MSHIGGVLFGAVLRAVRPLKTKGKITMNSTTIQKWLLLYAHSGATVDSAVSAAIYDTQLAAVEAARVYAADYARAHGVEVKEKGGCNGLPEYVYVETPDGNIITYRIVSYPVTVHGYVYGDTTADIRDMGLQELAIALGLSPLQITNLNEIGSQIKDDVGAYLDYVESLSPTEDVYLRHWLAAEGIEIERLETSEGEDA